MQLAPQSVVSQSSGQARVGPEARKRPTSINRTSSICLGHHNTKYQSRRAADCERAGLKPALCLGLLQRLLGERLPQLFASPRWQPLPTQGVAALMFARTDKENTPNAAELRSRSARAKRKYSAHNNNAARLLHRTDAPFLAPRPFCATSTQARGRITHPGQSKRSTSSSATAWLRRRRRPRRRKSMCTAEAGV